MLRIRQYIGFIVLRSLLCLAQAMPLDLGQTICRGLATLFNDVLKVRAKVIRENLGHAYPELTEEQRVRLAWGMWEHLFLFVFEVCHTPRKIHGTNFRKFVNFNGSPEFLRLFHSDRSLIVVMAHFGNFELTGYMWSLFGYETHAVARTLDNPYLDKFVNRFRGSTGSKILSKNDDYQKMVHVLDNGGILGFLADQYAGSKGCWVNFFNRPASAHKAIALFALQHDAPVLVGSCRRIGGPLQYEFYREGTVDPRDGGPETAGVKELTQWYTSKLETMIRRAPEQYWWLHRRWKDHRKAKKEKAAAA